MVLPPQRLCTILLLTADPPSLSTQREHDHRSQPVHRELFLSLSDDRRMWWI